MQFLTIPALLLTGFSPFLPACRRWRIHTPDLARSLRASVRDFCDGTSEWAVSRHPERLLQPDLEHSLRSLGPITAGWLQQNVGLSSSFVIAAGCVGLSGALLRLFFFGTRR